MTTTITVDIRPTMQGYTRADRLMQGDLVIIGDRVVELIEGHFVDFPDGDKPHVRLVFKSYGVLDEYEPDADVSGQIEHIVPKDVGYSRLTLNVTGPR